MPFRVPVFAVLLLPLLLISCIQPAIKPDPDFQPADSLEQLQLDESFDPLTLPADEILLPDMVESESAETQIGVNQRTENLPGDNTELSREGYQVQIHSGRNLEAAQEVQAQALLLFPDHAVELVWDAPNYKVRVGFFATREPAQTLKRRAQRLGYGKSWVVLAMRGED